ncbi:MAG: MerR family transcriptional regulator [Desulfobulbus sp.]|nr:MerR family transcriptional regulator [Desulfobulbus sp.]
MAPDFSQIPDKVYFRIGEVSELVGVETHVLRYWESEFALIKPHRGKSKQRLYRHKDVQTLLVIKDLLHKQGYTISGAIRFLKQAQRSHDGLGNLSDEHGYVQTQTADIIQQIKQELRAVLQQLGDGKIPSG